MPITTRKNNYIEHAAIIAVDFKDADISLNDEIVELKQLAKTAGTTIINTFIQVRNKVDPSTYVGKGKIKTIIGQVKELKCNLIIFNNELSPAQIKNIQKIAGESIIIIDRTALIIDIFNKHAKTKTAKTQVQIAKLKYLLPRLTNQWTHLERQMGGIGTRGGPGEKQIEIDRRLVRNKINKLKNDLLKIETQQKTQASRRKDAFRVAIVGYTNAGKSTLMEIISKADMYIQDELFATLDTTTRKVTIDSNSFVISDTVGFIRNLPHDLIASFKSTLSDVKEADLLIKVLDSTSTEIGLHDLTIQNVLIELNADKKPIITVLNKIDKINKLDILTSLIKKYEGAIPISALNQLNINDIYKSINLAMDSNKIKSIIKVPYAKSFLLDEIYKNCKVEKRVDDYDYIKLEIQASKEKIEQIQNHIKIEKHP